MHSSFKAIATPGCVLVGWLWLGPSPLVAQHNTQPSVSVVTFEGTGAPRDVRDAMADELAARLVDTGHFRVLHREWFPHQSDEVPKLDALRATAKSVNVDYLILGSIRQSSSLPVPQSSVMTSRGFAPAFGPHGMLHAPMPAGRVPPSQTTVIVNVQVVDVGTAEVVRTAAAERTYPTRNGPLLAPPIASRPPTLAAAVIAAIATRPKPPSTRLTKDWRQVVHDVAHQLDARGMPASHGR